MITRLLLVTLLASAALAGCARNEPNTRTRPGDAGVPVTIDDASVPMQGDAAVPPIATDAALAPISAPPGSRCSCDTECEGDAAHPGACVYGVCMTRPTAACASSGSRAECGAGSRCWRVRDADGHVCWPDCDSFTCAGTCDADGSCVGRGELDCDPSCGSFCSGAAPPDPPPTDPPTGACPDWRCTTDCAELVMLEGDTDPASAESLRRGYYIDTRERYTWLRRDLVLLLQHATCEVARRFPATTPLGIQDLSQSDGLTPGIDVGDARHPTTTHRGSDLDLSYYQTDGDNDAHIVCGDGSDTNGNGRAGRYNDGYFCTTQANIVDWQREAYFFAMLGTSPLVRIFGIDTTFVDDLREELDRQLGLGWITSAQHGRANDLGWGAAGGWQFHHHHSHMSFSRP